jgi:nucleotide-binding universal stress UspA family protein
MTVYSRILVPLEHSPTDTAILEHVRPLAKLCGAAIVLIHVADGWAARNLKQLSLRESEEMQKDRAYLEGVCAELEREGFDADAVLANGDPAAEILDAVQRERCDLIAMATHGHRLVGDIVYGSVANTVRHKAAVPVLMVRGARG